MAETTTALETTTPATTTPATTGATTTPPAATATPSAPPAPWYESLPDGLKGEKTLHAYKDVGAVAQALLEAKRWQSGALKIPGKDAKPEEVAAFWEKLGRPKAATDYDLSSLGEGIPVDKDRAMVALPHFHRLGLTNEQALGLIRWAVEDEKGRLDKVDEGYRAGLNKLADTWGKATFDRRAQLASRVIDRFASPALKEYLDTTRLTNHPELFQVFAQIGEQFAEDGIIDGRVEGVGTEQEIKDKIAVIRKELAAIGTDTPRARDLQAQMEDQYKLLHRGA